MYTVTVEGVGAPGLDDLIAFLVCWQVSKAVILVLNRLAPSNFSKLSGELLALEITSKAILEQVSSHTVTSTYLLSACVSVFNAGLSNGGVLSLARFLLFDVSIPSTLCLSCICVPCEVHAFCCDASLPPWATGDYTGVREGARGRVLSGHVCRVVQPAVQQVNGVVSELHRGS